MESADVLNRRKEFLSHVEKIHLEKLGRRKRTASQFNVFDSLGLTRSELAHSKFLRFLLSPNEQHGQGDTFLKAFLDRVVKLDVQEDLSRASVTTEKIVNEVGRIDIAIHLPDNRIVLVENKVDAREGLNQIERYQTWLEEQTPPLRGEHLLLFLSLDRKEPTSGNPGKVRCASYQDIANWLSPMVETVPDRLKVVLGQYIDTCRLIGGMRMADTHDLHELRVFLQDPNNIEIGFDVRDVVKDLCEKASHEFWDSVKAILRTRLRDSDAGHLWEMSEEPGRFGLFWKKRQKECRMFAVLLENMVYGIARGKAVKDKLDSRDVNITSAMKEEGFKSISADWSGYQYLYDYDQEFSFASEKNHIISFLRDNSNQSHPLATKAADAVWELFVRYQSELEELNSSYPY